MLITLFLPKKNLQLQCLMLLINNVRKHINGIILERETLPSTRVTDGRDEIVCQESMNNVLARAMSFFQTPPVYSSYALCNLLFVITNVQCIAQVSKWPARRPIMKWEGTWSDYIPAMLPLCSNIFQFGVSHVLNREGEYPSIAIYTVPNLSRTKYRSHVTFAVRKDEEAIIWSSDFSLFFLTCQALIWHSDTVEPSLRPPPN